MLPSSIGDSPDTGVRLRANTGVWFGISRSGTNTTERSEPVARGPLATKVMRLLGAGTQQAYPAWANPLIDVALPGTALRDGWLAARSMPTPNGYYRREQQGVWIV
jgi:hypothetical protein